jgi:hypothetical protein
MPTMHALCWSGLRGVWVSTASGGIGMSPPLGQTRWGPRISHTERALSFRNAIHLLASIFRCPAAHDLTDTLFGGFARWSVRR